ncbi:methyltransferase domain-containing protein [Nonomuraea sp. NPDC001831]|uniref:methyltransferase domain-containing protein n=1 Tax=Nonomuraea sp. NPDC001831 TaxID=3364340 RepID=UPI00368CEC58
MDAVRLRQAMVAGLRERQEIADDVADALLAVPRHLFLPGVDPRTAYRDVPIVTRRDEHGLPVSSSSQPSVMATMLGQLGVEPGHRVLEIGAGTGYNAALLARLAGPEGRVVSLDLDAGVVRDARRNLAVAGFPQVEVVCADGVEGFAAAAPYDRVIATVGVWDLAPAWLDQLAPGGRLVVPLDLRGVQVSVALERTGGHWAGRTVAPCGFMRLRGPSAGPESVVVLRRDPDLWLALPVARELGDLVTALETAPTNVAVTSPDPLPQPPPTADPTAGRDPLTTTIPPAGRDPLAEAGTPAGRDPLAEAGTPAGRDPLAEAGADVALWLALHEPRWCMLGGNRYGGYGGTFGLTDGSAIAVLASSASQASGPSGRNPDASGPSVRNADAADPAAAAGGPGRAELVAEGYGPGGTALAEELAAHVRAWAAAGRPRTTDLRLTAYRNPAPESAAPEGLAFDRPVAEGRAVRGPGREFVIVKRHTTLVLGFG